MKVKLCPQCGKQNDVNDWNCVDCGRTLSLNTIVEVGDIQSPQLAISGKGLLSGVSPLFQEDITELIKNHTRSSETIVKGCDICLPSILPPYKFGYILITSLQLICVRFGSELQASMQKAVIPKRPWLRRVMNSYVDGSSVDVTELLPVNRFVNRPTYALTETEKQSREGIFFQLSTLYSVELTNDVFLQLKFRPENGDTLVDLSVAFYFNDEAYGIYSSLAKK